MLRLCSDSSRSYPGRPVSLATVSNGATAGNGCRDGAGVSRSHSKRRTPSPMRLDGWKQARLAGKTYPAEGPNEEKGRSPNELS
jgi:hypothetical protein